MVHFARSYLNFEKLSEVGNNGRVERLVHIALGGCDIVLYPAGDGLPLFVNFAQHLVTLVNRSDNDADGGQIVNLVKRFALIFHLFVNGIKVFGSAENFTADFAFFKQFF